MIDANKTTASNGGTLFKFGSPVYDKGDMENYRASVKAIWPVFSIWSVRLYSVNGDGKLEQYLVIPASACIAPTNISEGSYDFFTSSGVSITSYPKPVMILGYISFTSLFLLL